MGTDRPNVIFLMLDTVRADSLDAYDGFTRTSAIRKLARKGTVYRNAIAPGTYTVPSHVSIFTGERVRSIGKFSEDPIKNCDRNTDPFLVKSKYIGEEKMTLAKKMRYVGYETALFSNNPFLSSPTGLASGFSYIRNFWLDELLEKNDNLFRRYLLKMIGNDTSRRGMINLAYYVSRLVPEESLDSLYLNLRMSLNRRFSEENEFHNMDRGAARTNSSIASYLDGSQAERKFIFINYMEGHEGYPTRLTHGKYIEQDKWLHMTGQVEDPNVPAIKEAYSKRIGYLDDQVGRLMQMLKGRGALDNTVLVVAGDHGQGFMEHNVMYHNMFPYDEVVRVPLITAKFENGRQVDTSDTVESFVSLTALHDSILKVGYGQEGIIDGSLRRDNFVFSDHVGITEVYDLYLLKLLRSRSKSADKIYREKLRNNRFATAVYHDRYKLVHFFNAREHDMLFDMESDPAEQNNIIGDSPAMGRELARMAEN